MNEELRNCGCAYPAPSFTNCCDCHPMPTMPPANCFESCNKVVEPTVYQQPEYHHFHKVDHIVPVLINNLHHHHTHHEYFTQQQQTVENLGYDYYHQTPQAVLPEVVSPFGAEPFNQTFGAEPFGAGPFGTMPMTNMPANSFGTTPMNTMGAEPFGTMPMTNMPANSFGTAPMNAMGTNSFGTMPMANMPANSFGTTPTTTMGTEPFGTTPMVANGNMTVTGPTDMMNGQTNNYNVDCMCTMSRPYGR